MQLSSLAKWMSKLLKAINYIPKLIIKLIIRFVSTFKEVEYKLLPSKAKKRVFRVQRKTISFYKRPMSDISHLSIIMVIILTLISGVSTSFGSSGKISTDPMVPQSAGTDTLVSTTEKKILEADSVVTLSGIYSDNLGQDALSVAENLNKKLNVTTGSGSYLSSMPIVSMPDNVASRNAITKYVVQNGDTISGIAQKFNITTDTIRYANQLADENSVKPGQTLTILPVTGLVYTVASGDTLESIASMYKANADMIVAQNDLYGENITAGMQLVIPDAEIPAAPVPVTTTTNNSAASSENNSESTSYYAPVNITYGPNHFPYGYCTWWVAQQRYVPWSGNAWQWYGNAQAYGRSVGQTPVPGAIMVTWESGYGHVAYVESVSGSSFTVTEMNYKGYGIVDNRTLTTSSVPLIGFIY